MRFAQTKKSFLRVEISVQWLNLGDKNSKVFFNSVKNHLCQSKIIIIHDDNDTCIIEAKKVNDCFENLFFSFF